MVLGAQRAVGLLDGRWTIDLLYVLARGRRRYAELYFELGNVSKKSLTATLRRLEQTGLVSRDVISEVPAHVEYALTPLGWSITDPVLALYEWTAANLGPEAASRRAA
jgi:DNA-binding HxlR family transcriptional regulator